MRCIEGVVMKYYFASKENFDGQVIKPKVPLHKYECEDSETERICVSQSINGCLTALSSRFGIGEIVYIHQCESDNIIQPTVEQVIDVCFTGEQWILEPVVMKLYIKIVIIGFMDAAAGNTNNIVFAFKLCE